MEGYGSIVNSLARRVYKREVPPLLRDPALPARDEARETSSTIVLAEGQSFIIEYLDSEGRHSTRRITVIRLARGKDGIPLLDAKCHERKARRAFRVDRIRACIDFDGVVHANVAEFIADNFGIPVELAGRTVGTPDSRWQDICSLIRPDAIVLSALSRSDGHVHFREREIIDRHLCFSAERAGIFLSEDDVNRISGFAQRLRPTGQAILSALDTVAQRPASEIRRLLLAAVEVVDADGRRHPAEMKMLSDLSYELTGAPLATVDDRGDPRQREWQAG